MAAADTLFLGFRFHPGHCDVLRLLLLQFLLELHQPDVVPQRRLDVVAPQLSLHVLQQLLYNSRLSLFFLLPLSFLTPAVYGQASGVGRPCVGK